MRNYLDIPMAVLAIILILTVLLYSEHLVQEPELTDKIIHLIAFTALSFQFTQKGRFGLFPIFVCCISFGGLSELIQPFFNRTADWSDWIADGIGVTIGISIGLIYRRHSDY